MDHRPVPAPPEPFVAPDPPIPPQTVEDCFSFCGAVVGLCDSRRPGLLDGPEPEHPGEGRVAVQDPAVESSDEDPGDVVVDEAPGLRLALPQGLLCPPPVRDVRDHEPDGHRRSRCLGPAPETCMPRPMPGPRRERDLARLRRTPGEDMGTERGKAGAAVGVQEGREPGPDEVLTVDTELHGAGEVRLPYRPCLVEREVPDRGEVVEVGVPVPQGLGLAPRPHQLLILQLQPRSGGPAARGPGRAPRCGRAARRVGPVAPLRLSSACRRRLVAPGALLSLVPGRPVS